MSSSHDNISTDYSGNTMSKQFIEKTEPQIKSLAEAKQLKQDLIARLNATKAAYQNSINRKKELQKQIDELNSQKVIALRKLDEQKQELVLENTELTDHLSQLPDSDFLDSQLQLLENFLDSNPARKKFEEAIRRTGILGKRNFSELQDILKEKVDQLHQSNTQSDELRTPTAEEMEIRRKIKMLQAVSRGMIYEKERDIETLRQEVDSLRQQYESTATPSRPIRSPKIYSSTNTPRTPRRIHLNDDKSITFS